jgi:oxygen-independent coproporphyrinogen-3 oxidase
VSQGRIPLDFATRLTKRQEMRRVIIRGLKMCEVFKQEFEDRFGMGLHEVYGTEIRSLLDAGLLAEDDDRVYLTREGQLYSTNVFEHFYTEEDLTPAAPGEVRFGISELVA